MRARAATAAVAVALVTGCAASNETDAADACRTIAFEVSAPPLPATSDPSAWSVSALSDELEAWRSLSDQLAVVAARDDTYRDMALDAAAAVRAIEQARTAVATNGPDMTTWSPQALQAFTELGGSPQWAALERTIDACRIELAR